MTDRFKDWQKPVIEEGKLTKWNWMVQHKDKLFMSKNVDIGAFSYLNCKWNIYIYDNVQIGSHVSLYTESTIDNKYGSIIINEGAKIGSHSTIMPNVVIGKNAIIGAYSFIKSGTHIPEGEIWFGIPAKKYIKQDSDFFQDGMNIK